eukprot:6202128-Pleurochrysis_carterae.AAC.1
MQTKQQGGVTHPTHRVGDERELRNVFEHEVHDVRTTARRCDPRIALLDDSSRSLTVVYSDTSRFDYMGTL